MVCFLYVVSNLVTFQNRHHLHHRILRNPPSVPVSLSSILKTIDEKDIGGNSTAATGASFVTSGPPPAPPQRPSVERSTDGAGATFVSFQNRHHQHRLAY